MFNNYNLYLKIPFSKLMSILNQFGVHRSKIFIFDNW